MQIDSGNNWICTLICLEEDMEKKKAVFINQCEMNIANNKLMKSADISYAFKVSFQ